MCIYSAMLRAAHMCDSRPPEEQNQQQSRAEERRRNESKRRMLLSGLRITGLRTSTGLEWTVREREGGRGR